MNHVLHAAHARAQAEFHRFRTVVGVGIGPKVVRGRVITGESIVVLVDKKLPAKHVPKGELIPRVFEGFPTDVRVPELQATLSKRKDASPFRSGNWCLTDYRWIDWTKVHQMNLEQHPELRDATTRARQPRGKSRGTSDH
jgi:hypothetical protein